MNKIIQRSSLLIFMGVLSSNILNAQLYEWAESMGGSGGDYCRSISVDGAGNVYMTGYFTGTADFTPGPDTANLTSNGSYDIFIAKYDSSGNYRWAINIGGSTVDEGYAISLDNAANVYVTGYFTGTADFDPGTDTVNLTSNGPNYDLFIAKYDSSGNFGWAINMGGTGAELGRSIALDNASNVYVTGHFTDTADFDPGPDTTELTPNGVDDIFVAKYDSNGNFAWAVGIGGGGYDQAHSLALDNAANVYITGNFEVTVDFDPGPGTANLTSKGSRDIFIAKYNSNGNFNWAKSIGGSSLDFGRSISADGVGNVYITGNFSDTVDFDPGPGIAELSGFIDIFIAKYDSSGNYSWAKSMGGSQADYGWSTYVDDSANLYVTGYFKDTVDFDPGPNTANMTPYGGINYDVFIAKYDKNGNYSWARKMGGNNSDYGNAIALDGAGNVYIGGRFSDSANFDPCIDNPNLTSNGGADAFIAKYSPSDLDTSVTIVGITATSNATVISYQWIDCNNGFMPIPGENNQSFTPSQNGNYAIVVAQKTCADTSACYIITVVGVENPNSYQAYASLISIHPNPAKNKISVELNKTHSEILVTIINIQGQEILTASFGTQEVVDVDMKLLNAGIYFIRINTGDEIRVFKVIKE